jgi:hypothetical protein
MTACLHALSDDEVASNRLRGTTLVDRANLPTNERATIMPSVDEHLDRIAFEELDDLHPAGCLRHNLDWRHIWDQEPDPRRAEFRWGRLSAVGNHAEAAFGGNDGSEVGRPHAAENRELEGQPTADEVGEARVHWFATLLRAVHYSSGNKWSMN